MNKNITKALIIGTIALAAVDTMAGRRNTVANRQPPGPYMISLGLQIQREREAQEAQAREARAQIIARQQKISDILDKMDRNNDAIRKKRSAGSLPDEYHEPGINVDTSEYRENFKQAGDDRNQLEELITTLSPIIETQDEWLKDDARFLREQAAHEERKKAEAESHQLQAQAIADEAEAEVDLLTAVHNAAPDGDTDDDEAATYHDADGRSLDTASVLSAFSDASIAARNQTACDRDDDADEAGTLPNLTDDMLNVNELRSFARASSSQPSAEYNTDI